MSNVRTERIKGLEIEYDEVYQRCMRLKAAISDANAFEFTHEHMQKLMYQQYGVMLAYMDVLRQRIASETLVNSLGQNHDISCTRL